MDFKLIKTIFMMVVFGLVAVTVIVSFIAIFVKQINILLENKKIKKSSKFFDDKIENDEFIEIPTDEYMEFLKFKKFQNSKK